MAMHMHWTKELQHCIVKLRFLAYNRLAAKSKTVLYKNFKKKTQTVPQGFKNETSTNYTDFYLFLQVCVVQGRIVLRWHTHLPYHPMQGMQDHFCMLVEWSPCVFVNIILELSNR